MPKPSNLGRNEARDLVLLLVTKKIRLPKVQAFNLSLFRTFYLGPYLFHEEGSLPRQHQGRCWYLPIKHLYFSVNFRQS